MAKKGYWKVGGQLLKWGDIAPELSAIIRARDDVALRHFLSQLSSDSRKHLIHRVVAEQRVSLDSWALRVFYDFVKKSFAVVSIASHPAADEDLLLEVVRTHPRHLEVLRSVIKSDWVSRSPALREALLSVEHAGALRLLARHLHDEEFRMAYLRTVDEQPVPGHALLILEEASDAQLSALEPRDVIPLLDKGSLERRLRAQAAAARVVDACMQQASARTRRSRAVR